MSETTFEIVLGTYEEFLLGYRFCSTDCKISQSFASHDHSGSIRCVDLARNFLASGGADDRIFIYDLKKRQEHCMLTNHSSTINCLQFTLNRSHLMCGTTDGSITITRVGSWLVEKIWEKAHKGCQILDIAIHPSGKLALSLGGDHILRTWNLIKGRQAYAINLNSKTEHAKSLEHIAWAPCGIRFLLLGGRATEVWSIETGGIVTAMSHNSKVVSCVWISHEEFIAGYENGKLALVNSITGKINVKDGHNGRIKTIRKYEKWIISASSDGIIKVWDLSLNELSKFDTGCRLMCLCVAPPLKIKKEENSESNAIIDDSIAKHTNPIKRRVAEVIEECDTSEADEETLLQPSKTENYKGIETEIKNKNQTKKVRGTVNISVDRNAGSKIKKRKQKKKNKVVK